MMIYIVYSEIGNQEKKNEHYKPIRGISFRRHCMGNELVKLGRFIHWG